MFDRIEVFSNKIARKFTDIFCIRKHTKIQNNETKKFKITYNETVKQYEKRFEEELELYEYFFFFLTSHFIEIGTIIILSLIFNYWKSSLIMLPIFIVMRSKSGGLHASDFKSCYFTSVGLLSIGGLLAKFLQPLYIIFAIISMFFAILILPNTPKPSENAESRGLETDKRFQKQYSFRLLFLYCVQIILIYLTLNSYNLQFISTGISSGLLIVAFISSEFGEKIMNKIWNIM